MYQKQIRNICLTLFGMISMMTAMTYSQEYSEKYHYHDKIGDHIYDHHILVEEHPSYHKITILREPETVIIYTDEKGEKGTSMQVNRKEENSRFRVVRQGNYLTFTGIIEGEKISKTTKIDTRPWINAPGIMLRDHFLKKEEKIDFWIISSRSATVIKMEIYELGEEEIEMNGKWKTYTTYRMAPQGWKAFFWKATLWVDPETGETVLYRGPLQDEESTGQKSNIFEMELIGKLR
ncbi:MAG: hypothetical protein VW378_02670 [bacterium]